MSPTQVLELLHSECERGIVVETPEGAFRLSERAEQLFGSALRGLPEGPYRQGRRPGRPAA